MLLEVKLQALAKLVRSPDEGELLQNSRRLRVNDGAVGGFGIFEVRNLLINRCCTFCGIYLVGTRLDGLIEARPDIHLWFQRRKSLISHVLREALFQPKVVEPTHRHQIAEPLVRELMQDDEVAVQQIAVGRGSAKQDRLFPQESGASVFHSSVGKTGDKHHVVLGKWELLSEKIREVLHATGRDLLHFGSLGLR